MIFSIRGSRDWLLEDNEKFWQDQAAIHETELLEKYGPRCILCNILINHPLTLPAEKGASDQTHDCFLGDPLAQ